ncbi:hypothetical protein [Amycolatopsis coloradensis]|uniref:hypothetical protein n=1 Tax=Amycolatopsis coloradensis TaxID=76021 RepID=UPI001300DE4F|nr:hypothetical protein [Amycolatopsis coloradensis]
MAVVPDFVGKQALDAWLSGHDAGLTLQGPDPDSPCPLLNGQSSRKHRRRGHACRGGVW